MKLRKSSDRARSTNQTLSHIISDFDTITPPGTPPRMSTESPSSTPRGSTSGNRRSLPIADEFMRSPTIPKMPPPLSPTSQQTPEEQPAQRDSVLDETERDPMKPAPLFTTIHKVPQDTAGGDADIDADSERSRSGRRVDDLAPNFSRLSIGNTRRSSLDSARSPPAESTQQQQAQRATVARSGSARKINIARKPLPPLPTDESPALVQNEHFASTTNSRPRNLERELGVEGQVDLSNTTDTSIHTNYALAVTHETITQPVHEIVEKPITREIHQDHVYHRILPVEEVEVLPARHFIKDDRDQLREVPASQLTGRMRSGKVEKAVQKAFEKQLPKATANNGSRKFTARGFQNTEGEYMESVGKDGVARSERWWVHPPTLENGGRETGQTVPFYLGSKRLEKDGWRG